MCWCMLYVCLLQYTRVKQKQTAENVLIHWSLCKVVGTSNCHCNYNVLVIHSIMLFCSQSSGSTTTTPTSSMKAPVSTCSCMPASFKAFAEDFIAVINQQQVSWRTTLLSSRLIRRYLWLLSNCCLFVPVQLFYLMCCSSIFFRSLCFLVALSCKCYHRLLHKCNIVDY